MHGHHYTLVPVVQPVDVAALPSLDDADAPTIASAAPPRAISSRSLYHRVATYPHTAPARDASSHQQHAPFDMLERHRDSPALFLSGRANPALWSQAQRAELIAHFGVRGCVLSPALLDLAGPVRPCAPNTSTTKPDQAVSDSGSCTRQPSAYACEVVCCDAVCMPGA